MRSGGGLARRNKNKIKNEKRNDNLFIYCLKSIIIISIIFLRFKGYEHLNIHDKIMHNKMIILNKT